MGKHGEASVKSQINGLPVRREIAAARVSSHSDHVNRYIPSKEQLDFVNFDNPRGKYLKAEERNEERYAGSSVQNVPSQISKNGLPCSKLLSKNMPDIRKKLTTKEAGDLHSIVACPEKPFVLPNKKYNNSPSNGDGSGQCISMKATQTSVNGNSRRYDVVVDQKLDRIPFPRNVESWSSKNAASEDIADWGLSKQEPVTITIQRYVTKHLEMFRADMLCFWNQARPGVDNDKVEMEMRATAIDEVSLDHMEINLHTPTTIPSAEILPEVMETTETITPDRIELEFSKSQQTSLVDKKAPIAESVGQKAGQDELIKRDKASYEDIKSTSATSDCCVKIAVQTSATAVAADEGVKREYGVSLAACIYADYKAFRRQKPDNVDGDIAKRKWSEATESVRTTLQTTTFYSVWIDWGVFEQELVTITIWQHTIRHLDMLFWWDHAQPGVDNDNVYTEMHAMTIVEVSLDYTEINVPTPTAAGERIFSQRSVSAPNVLGTVPQICEPTFGKTVVANGQRRNGTYCEISSNQMLSHGNQIEDCSETGIKEDRTETAHSRHAEGIKDDRRPFSPSDYGKPDAEVSAAKSTDAINDFSHRNNSTVNVCASGSGGGDDNENWEKQRREPADKLSVDTDASKDEDPIESSIRGAEILRKMMETADEMESELPQGQETSLVDGKTPIAKSEAGEAKLIKREDMCVKFLVQTSMTTVAVDESVKKKDVASPTAHVDGCHQKSDNVDDDIAERKCSEVTKSVGTTLQTTTLSSAKCADAIDKDSNSDLHWPLQCSSLSDNNEIFADNPNNHTSTDKAVYTEPLDHRKYSKRKSGITKNLLTDVGKPDSQIARRNETSVNDHRKPICKKSNHKRNQRKKPFQKCNRVDRNSTINSTSDPDAAASQPATAMVTREATQRKKCATMHRSTVPKKRKSLQIIRRRRTHRENHKSLRVSSGWSAQKPPNLQTVGSGCNLHARKKDNQLRRRRLPSAQPLDSNDELAANVSRPSPKLLVEWSSENFHNWLPSQIKRRLPDAVPWSQLKTVPPYSTSKWLSPINRHTTQLALKHNLFQPVFDELPNSLGLDFDWNRNSNLSASRLWPKPHVSNSVLVQCLPVSCTILEPQWTGIACKHATLERLKADISHRNTGHEPRTVLVSESLKSPLSDATRFITETVKPDLPPELRKLSAFGIEVKTETKQTSHARTLNQHSKKANALLTHSSYTKVSHAYATVSEDLPRYRSFSQSREYSRFAPSGFSTQLHSRASNCSLMTRNGNIISCAFPDGSEIWRSGDEGGVMFWCQINCNKPLECKEFARPSQLQEFFDDDGEEGSNENESGGHYNPGGNGPDEHPNNAHNNNNDHGDDGDDGDDNNGGDDDDGGSDGDDNGDDDDDDDEDDDDDDDDENNDDDDTNPLLPVQARDDDEEFQMPWEEDGNDEDDDINPHLPVQAMDDEEEFQMFWEEDANAEVHHPFDDD